MKDKCFIDTNILVYISTNEDEKRIKATELIYKLENATISTQVLTEFSNVIIRKKIFPESKLKEYIKRFSNSFNIEILTDTTILKALDIKMKYQFSLWDSLILAASLQSNCTILYSEDLHHSQVIENKIKIINPFID